MDEENRRLMDILALADTDKAEAQRQFNEFMDGEG